MSQAQAALTVEQRLWQTLAAFRSDVLGYVMWSFPWSTDTSIQLVKLQEPWRSRYDSEWGPDAWACEYFDWLSSEIQKRGFDPAAPVAQDAIQTAIVSGHGIGKGASVGQLGCFMMDTRPMSKGIVTANTGAQLRTKTFAEIAKWRGLSVASKFWEISLGDLYIRHTMFPSKWRLDGMTWREHQAQAFAGLHAADSSPYFIGDEASTIPPVILGTAQGGLTDGEPFFLLFGNGTEPSGYFFECFHKMRHRFKTWHIDSRDVQITNKRKLQEWIDDNGEDSDYCRVRVKGMFPRSGSSQFIGHDLVDMAQKRELPPPVKDDPVVMMIDVARFGGDETVIGNRRGVDCRTVEWKAYRGLDTMQTVARAVEYWDYLMKIGWPPSAIFVDGTGIGAGVVDRLGQLGYPVIEVHFGARANDRAHFARADAEMWGGIREWLDVGCLPEADHTLADQLTGRQYSYTPGQQVQLERKDDMKKRGLDSPDRADCLALSFRHKVAAQTAEETEARHSYDADFDPLEGF